jgi:hypothetical protein
MSKMKYAACFDGTDSTIICMPEDMQVGQNLAGSVRFYPTLTEARVAIATDLRQRRNQYNDAIRRIEAITPKSVMTYRHEDLEPGGVVG